MKSQAGPRQGDRRAQCRLAGQTARPDVPSPSRMHVFFDGRDVGSMTVPLPRGTVLEFPSERPPPRHQGQIFNAVYGSETGRGRRRGHISKLRRKLRLRLGRDVIDASVISATSSSPTRSARGRAARPRGGVETETTAPTSSSQARDPPRRFPGKPPCPPPSPRRLGARRTCISPICGDPRRAPKAMGVAAPPAPVQRGGDHAAWWRGTGRAPGRRTPVIPGERRRRGDPVTDVGDGEARQGRQPTEGRSKPRSGWEVPTVRTSPPEAASLCSAPSTSSRERLGAAPPLAPFLPAPLTGSRACSALPG